jgi:signal transduction histidine kinase
MVWGLFRARGRYGMNNKEHIKVLLIEDDPDHAYLFREILRDGKGTSIDIRHSDKLSSALESLSAEQFDIIVSDLGLPDSQGIETFLSIHTRYPDTPIIVLTGMSDEDLAIKAVQSGAQDYLVKGRVEGDLLIRSMRYAIERQKMIAQLEKNLKEIKTLRGLIPMCAWCRNIRDDKGYWKKVEKYIEEHTDASFTHGICPRCMKKVNPELHEKILKDDRLKKDAEESPEDAAPEDYGSIKVLLLEDDPGDADYIRALLSETEGRVNVVYSDRLSSGIEHLAKEKFDVVLSDLGLPDSQGIETFIRIHTLYPDLPVIVLTGLHDEELAVKAVRSGAQDYLVKGRVDGGFLLKSMRYSVERQKLITTLENRLMEIGKLGRERKNILSMFAHDIKNAIIPSIGFLARTLSGKTKDAKADLELVRDKLTTAEHLLKTFIEFSRFETEEYKPLLGPFDLEAAVLKQIESATREADQKQIKITYNFSERPFPPVEADGAMIHRVIANLLDNAVKYTIEGTIGIRVMNIPQDVLVEVKDTGIGIDNDQIPHIFDAFYRAAHEVRGSGLGLSIARTIVEAHGGQIWVKSAPGMGSTFSFTLPRQ